MISGQVFVGVKSIFVGFLTASAYFMYESAGMVRMVSCWVWKSELGLESKVLQIRLVRIETTLVMDAYRKKPKFGWLISSRFIRVELTELTFHYRNSLRQNPDQI